MNPIFDSLNKLLSDASKRQDKAGVPQIPTEEDIRRAFAEDAERVGDEE